MGLEDFYGRCGAVHKIAEDKRVYDFQSRKVVCITGSLLIDKDGEKEKRFSCKGTLNGNHNDQCAGLTPFQEGVSRWRHEVAETIRARASIPAHEQKAIA